jgi:protein phosphatase 1 regulatory subunit 42
MTPNLRYRACGQVLYLYGNAIEKVENLDFATKLTHLYLQNNRLTDFPSEGFGSLQKLFLDGNQITTFTGLQQATNLQELHLKHQQLQEGQCLTVSMDTLHAVSFSLRLINVSQNAMVHFDCFQVLTNLEEFYGQE